MEKNPHSTYTHSLTFRLESRHKKRWAQPRDDELFLPRFLICFPVYQSTNKKIKLYIEKRSIAENNANESIAVDQAFRSHLVFSLSLSLSLCHLPMLVRHVQNEWMGKFGESRDVECRLWLRCVYICGHFLWQYWWVSSTLKGLKSTHPPTSKLGQHRGNRFRRKKSRKLFNRKRKFPNEEKADSKTMFCSQTSRQKLNNERFS